ncbi:MAG: hypothetical protein JWR40_1000, partial [Massilia sp.]|nr:hypothetical protein [Massilia sp.]
VGFTRVAGDSALIQWVEQRSNGAFGAAVILPSASGESFAEDKRNALILAPASAGKPLRYYVGAAWTRSGDFKSGQDWQRYVAAEAARARTPVTVNLAGGRALD